MLGIGLRLVLVFRVSDRFYGLCTVSLLMLLKDFRCSAVHTMVRVHNGAIVCFIWAPTSTAPSHSLYFKVVQICCNDHFRSNICVMAIVMAINLLLLLHLGRVARTFS